LRVLMMAQVGPQGSDGCGERSILSTASYDRGLGIPLSIVGHHAEAGRVEIDGFGRVLRTYLPKPSALGEVSTVASSESTYFMPDDPSTTPYRWTRTRIQNGASADDAVYSESWRFEDSLGREIVALAPADKTAGDEGSWVASGFVDFDSFGRSKR